MIDPIDTEIDVDEIMRKIREEVKKRKPPEQETLREPEPLTPKSSSPGEPEGLVSKPSTPEEDSSKKIFDQSYDKSPLQSPVNIDVLPYYINYHGFLVQVKEKEGLKGRIKHFLFKFIRFYAWWQEQINRALYQELIAQKARMDEREKWIQEILHQQFNQIKGELSQELSDQRKKIVEAESKLMGLLSQQNDQLRVELTERDRVLGDLGSRVSSLGQAKDELSQELSDQRKKMVEAESKLMGLLSQQNDQLRVELTERDRVLGDLGSRVSSLGQAKDEISRELSDQRKKMVEAESKLMGLLSQQNDQLRVELTERDRVLGDLGSRVSFLGQAKDELSKELSDQKNKLNETGKWVESLFNQGMASLRSELTESHRGLNDTIESTKKELSELIEIRSTIHQMAEEIRKHKFEILEQQRRLTSLLEEARKRLLKTVSSKQIENILKEEDHLLDAMYVFFEDRFRGTREEIKERLRVYLPYVKQAQIGEESSPILDLGCGRGEWLELLKENGYIAKGVDFNRVMIRKCQEIGLEVIDSDIIEYLTNQQPNSFGAITGFHILEHLPYKSIISLFDETLRVLKSGGMVIFETPNPENLIVGACNFYFDPTHRNPLPPRLLSFLIESRGFEKTEIIRLHPLGFFREEQKTSDVVKVLATLFNAEQDYSVIAYKG
ncbi:MAG: methyltransferase domain-containing protein [Syntrophaceae bacterium]|nr:methyltransferase domain-containing protein [Syntrophaceae bacterium]